MNLFPLHPVRSRSRRRRRSQNKALRRLRRE